MKSAWLLPLLFAFSLTPLTGLRADGEKLDDEALEEAGKKIIKRVKLKLIRQSRDPGDYKRYIDQLEDLLERAKDPKSGVATSLLILKAQIHMQIRQVDEAMAAHDVVLEAHPKGRFAEVVFMEKARYFTRTRSVGGLEKLLAAAEDHAISRRTRTAIKNNIFILKARRFSKLDKKDDLEALIAEGKREKLDSETLRILDDQRAKLPFAVGKTFPDFKIGSIEGKEIDLAKLSGKVVLVHFWAVWHGPSLAQITTVRKLYEDYKSKGLEIISISLDMADSEGTVKDFIEDKELTWPHHFDGKGWRNDLALKYAISSLPATFVLDGKGTILDRDVLEDDLDKVVRKALGLGDEPPKDEGEG